ncbi:MAG: hypothetical protein Ct9H300mP6_16690 [Gammaproteobacteria bacterium]|nr:MAG: hypothetical protein Ct9H300mP6_16690 [Gammaproteobacteria bacterium]
MTYGQADWVTNEATKTGYSRAVEQKIIADDDDEFPIDLRFFINSYLFLIILE